MSKILTDAQLWHLDELLPARTRFNRLELLYSTWKHGYSLQSIYRRMAAQAENIRATVLTIRSSDCEIFGAILSCPIVPKRDFYGNGETVLYSFTDSGKLHSFHWTGKNNFFVKSDPESLAIGADCGRYGLWIDAELIRGRTQHCATFDNDPLTLNEDFTISDVEIWIAVI